MADERKTYNLNVAELNRVLRDQKEVRVNMLEEGKEMVLFDIKRISDLDGRLHDNNNVFC